MTTHLTRPLSQGHTPASLLDLSLQSLPSTHSPIAEVLIRQGSFRVWGGWPRLQHYGAAGDINGHAGMFNEEVLQGIALEAGRPKAGPLCSKTGGRGNKPALVHQGGRGWWAACRSRRGPRVGRSCIAVYRVWEWEAMQRRRSSRVGHTHTYRTQGMGRERASLVRPASLPIVPREHLKARILSLLP